MAFVRAQSGPPAIGDPESKFTVQYFDEDGNMTIRTGGTRAWRCNNPGNLRRSRYSMSKQRGAIGWAGYGQDQYPVYPDLTTGRQALIVMLKGAIYGPLSIEDALKRYEPGNYNYVDIVVQRTGLSPLRTLHSLNEEEFRKLWQAIEFVERWEAGKEDFIEKWIISGVHRKRGTIFEYCIDKPQGTVWAPKAEAIALANEGRLHAIVVHRKNGTTFLRPEYKNQPFQLFGATLGADQHWIC